MGILRSGRIPAASRFVVALAAVLLLLVAPTLGQGQAGGSAVPAIRLTATTDADDAGSRPRLLVTALAGAVSRLWAVPLDGAASPVLLGEVDHRPGFGVAVALDTGGSRLALIHLPADRANASAGGRLDLVDLAAGSARPLADGADLRVAPRWSPDGKFLLFDRLLPGGPDRQAIDLAIVPVEAAGPVASLVTDADPAAVLASVGWTADGQVLYTRQTPAGTDLWQIDPASRARRLLGHLTDGLAAVPALSTDRRWLAFADRQRSGTGYSEGVSVADVATGQVLPVRRGGGPDWLAWQGDGGLATGSSSEGVAIWRPPGAPAAQDLSGIRARPIGGAERWLPALDAVSPALLRRPDGLSLIDPAGGERAVPLPGYLHPVGILAERSDPAGPAGTADEPRPAVEAKQSASGEGLLLLDPPAIAAAAGDSDRCAQTGARPYQPTLDEVNLVLERAASARLGPAYPQMPTIGQGWPDVVSVSPTAPCVILKSIAFIESGWRQADYAVARGGSGDPLISSSCAYGVGQIASGMQHRGDLDPALQYRIANDYVTNVAYSAKILADKWRATPAVGNNDPAIAEDWFYAVWAYYGFSYYNNPNNPRWDPSRPPFNGSQSYGTYPYQELVWGIAANPPVLGGERLWEPVPLTLPADIPPDSSNLANAGRIPVDPQPIHTSTCPAASITRSPDRLTLYVDQANRQAQEAAVALRDPFGASFAWQVQTSAAWLTTGAATGDGLPADLTIRVDPSGLSLGSQYASVLISSPDGSFRPLSVEVEVIVTDVRRLSLPFTARSAG